MVLDTTQKKPSPVPLIEDLFCLVFEEVDLSLIVNLFQV